MKKFKMFIHSSECSHCRKEIPVIRKINRKFEERGKGIKFLNIRDSENFGIVVYPIIKILNYEGEDKLHTPHLSFGEIKNGKMQEHINIKGHYESDILDAFLNGYLNNEFSEDFKEGEK